MFSKTNYTDGCQCPKILWMQRNMPEQREVDDAQQALIDSGVSVGELAREWAGNHTLISNDYDFPRMVSETAAAIESGSTVCEATFAHGDYVCLSDICTPRSDGSLDLFEVKASTKVKPYHLLDLAFQVWVAECSGYRVASASVVHLNSAYRLDNDLDLNALFVSEDCTEAIRAHISTISEDIASFIEVRRSKAEPDMPIGRQCNSPHPCPFQKWCWRDVPSDSVFSLAGMGRLKGLKHWNGGVRTFSDVLAAADSDMKLNALQRAQALGCAHIDKEHVGEFLNGLHFPLYFLDFETVQHAVPVYQGTKPYQQVPTQFSLHWFNEPDGVLYHAEYLAPSTGDPRRGVAEALVDTIPSNACVTAYNMSFEKGRIKELADFYPDLSQQLMSIHCSIADLMTPFKSGWVYLPAMDGSYSIKKVLPALYPDSSEFDYTKLDGIHNGSEAMAAFSSLATLSKAEQSRIREQLLRYCELDTLAMVKVWEWLVGSLL